MDYVIMQKCVRSFSVFLVKELTLAVYQCFKVSLIFKIVFRAMFLKYLLS